MAYCGARLEINEERTLDVDVPELVRSGPTEEASIAWRPEQLSPKLPNVLPRARRRSPRAESRRQFEQAADQTNESRSVADVKLLSPLREPSKIVCLGVNYRSHMLKTNSEQPGGPVVFSKFASSIIGPGDAIVIPAVAPSAWTMRRSWPL